jgi:hypothetical protein
MLHPRRTLTGLAPGLNHRPLNSGTWTLLPPVKQRNSNDVSWSQQNCNKQIINGTAMMDYDHI